MGTLKNKIRDQKSRLRMHIFFMLSSCVLLFAETAIAAWNNGTIYCTVWNDSNNNAQIDAGENGIAGIVLKLQLTNKTSKQQTRELGQCSFKNQYADKYEISIDPVSLPVGATCTNGALSRFIQVDESICDPTVTFGFAGIPADYLGDEIIPTVPEDIDPNLAPNSLVLVAGTPVYPGMGGLGWDNATDGDTEGWDGTALAAVDPKSGDDRPWAIFRFADGAMYSFNYITFQTDNGTADDGAKHDNQAKRIQVLISNAGIDPEDFTPVGTFVRTSGTNRLQWNKLPSYRTAKYIKIRLLDPIPKYSGSYLQIVEFGVNTEKKKGPELVLESLIIIAGEDDKIYNFPNPFNPVTTIYYDLENNSDVSIEIFDLTGKQVAVLVNEYQISGKHQTSWNAGDMPSGVYFLTMRSGGKSVTKRIMLMK